MHNKNSFLHRYISAATNHNKVDLFGVALSGIW